MAAGISCRDLATAIGIPLNLMPANLAGKCLQFEIVAVFRMRRASRQAHETFAFRAGRGIGDAKAVWHGVFLLAQETNLPLSLAFQ
jgi:hypothetical protein